MKKPAGRRACVRDEARLHFLRNCGRKSVYTLFLALASPSGGAAGFRYDADDVVDDGLDQLRIVAFGHDADERLGAGGPDDEAAGLAETVARLFDRRLDRRLLQRLA